MQKLAERFQRQDEEHARQLRDRDDVAAAQSAEIEQLRRQIAAAAFRDTGENRVRGGGFTLRSGFYHFVKNGTLVSHSRMPETRTAAQKTAVRRSALEAEISRRTLPSQARSGA